MFGKNIDVKQIVQGHINEFTNKEQDLSATRLAICKDCPICSEGIAGPYCDSTKCVDKNTHELVSKTRSGNIICGCGCRLKAKTTLKNAHCVLDKW